MKYKKNFEVADIMELIKISNEFIERNRKIYERLAAGIPTQGIIDSLVPGIGQSIWRSRDPNKSI